jgi:hypothetical protein
MLCYGSNFLAHSEPPYSAWQLFDWKKKKKVVFITPTEINSKWTPQKYANFVSFCPKSLEDFVPKSESPKNVIYIIRIWVSISLLLWPKLAAKIGDTTRLCKHKGFCFLNGFSDLLNWRGILHNFVVSIIFLRFTWCKNFFSCFSNYQEPEQSNSIFIIESKFISSTTFPNDRLEKHGFY